MYFYEVFVHEFLTLAVDSPDINVTEEVWMKIRKLIYVPLLR